MKMGNSECFKKMYKAVAATKQVFVLYKRFKKDPQQCTGGAARMKKGSREDVCTDKERELTFKI